MKAYASGGGGGGAGGDVVGPGSSTDNAAARFDGATGKLLQDSSAIIDDSGNLNLNAGAGTLTAANQNPTSSTDNIATRFDGTGGKTQGSDISIADASGASVTVATTAGNALAIAVTAPAATTGASQAGKAASITASAAVASTDTDGAAAGGNVTITAGAAARRNSGNANGGNVVLTGGAGIGTGTQGQIQIPATPASLAAAPTLAFGDLDTGFYESSDDNLVITTGGGIKYTITSGGDINQANSTLSINNNGFVQGRIGVTVQATTPKSLNATTETGVLYTNEGASAKIVFNLPSAAVRYIYEFFVQDTDGIQVVASAGDTIRINGSVSAAAGNIDSTTVGSWARLVAINATEWVACGSSGTWTVT